MRNKKILIPTLLVLAVAIFLIGRVILMEKNQPNTNETEVNFPEVTITMDDGGQIVLELYPGEAPNTVNNFIYLANKGFYNGLIFHRVIEGFMIQGGDPNGNGTGGPGYSIKGEFKENGIDNDLQHVRGVISMARTPEPNSAGSQFFIMHRDAHQLDGKYAAFGKVITGLDVVDRIADVDTGPQDKPVVSQVIKEVTVDSFGKDYPEPEMIKQ